MTIYSLCRLWSLAFAGCAATCGASAQAESDVIAVAIEIGLTPESIVLAQLDEELPGLLLALESVPEMRQALDQAHESADVAAALLTELSKEMLSEAADPYLVAEYQSAMTELNDSRAQVETFREVVFQHVTNPISQDQLDALALWRDASIYRVPAAFMVLDRTPEEWKIVEKAMRAEKRAMRRGETLNAAYAQLLGDIRSDIDVVEALQRIEANLATIDQVFKTYEPGE